LGPGTDFRTTVLGRRRLRADNGIGADLAYDGGMNRHRSLRTALCVAFALTAHCALGQDKPAALDTLKRIRDSGTITIGVREASVPFSFIDAQKQPQGYSIDLCLRVADAIKNELKLARLDVRFLPVTSANRIEMVKDGKVVVTCEFCSSVYEFTPEQAGVE